MRDVPKVSGTRLTAFVEGLAREGSQAVVLLATDLPSFASIAEIERRTGLPVLTSNQTILWRALRMIGNGARIAALGRLFHV